MGQMGGRAYLDGNNELMEIPAPNVANIESQDLQWELFEPKEGQRRSKSFNMEVRECKEEKAEQVRWCHEAMSPKRLAVSVQ